MKNITENIDAFFTKFYRDFQKYVFSNNILVSASAYSIGFATHQLIVNILKLFAPTITSLFVYFINIDKTYIGFNNIPFIYNILSGLIAILGNIIVWLLTIVLTFLFVEYLLYNNISGLKTTVKEEEEKDFIVAKTEAKEENNTPLSLKAKEIKIKEKSEDIIGQKIVKEKNSRMFNELFTDNYDLKKNDLQVLSDNIVPINNASEIIEPFQSVKSNMPFGIF